jgi:hypothetical protein
VAKTGEQLLFDVDLEKVRRAIDDWGWLTSDETRDRGIDAFFALMGSAQMYLKGVPNIQVHVIAKLNDYMNAIARWRSLDRATMTLKDRILRGIGEVQALTDMPNHAVPEADPIDPAKEAAANEALNKVKGEVDKLKKQLAEKEKAEEEKKEPPWWLVPAVGAGAAYLVPKFLSRMF